MMRLFLAFSLTAIVIFGAICLIWYLVSNVDKQVDQLRAFAQRRRDAVYASMDYEQTASLQDWERRFDLETGRIEEQLAHGAISYTQAKERLKEIQFTP